MISFTLPLQILISIISPAYSTSGFLGRTDARMNSAVVSISRSEVTGSAAASFQTPESLSRRSNVRYAAVAPRFPWPSYVRCFNSTRIPCSKGVALHSIDSARIGYSPFTNNELAGRVAGVTFCCATKESTPIINSNTAKTVWHFGNGLGTRLSNVRDCR